MLAFARNPCATNHQIGRTQKQDYQTRISPYFSPQLASHLLQANIDIRTIQELLGHSDLKTTMTYTHTVPTRTIKEAKSPLDF